MDDLISRADAIEVADAVWSVTGDKNVAKVWDQLLNLPSAQQWIPVTERPPEPGVEVWLTIKGSDVITLQGDETLEEAVERVMNLRWVTRGYWSDEEKMWCDPHFGFPLMVQPVAWMLIDVPEPWKGEA